MEVEMSNKNVIARFKSGYESVFKEVKEIHYAENEYILKNQFDKVVGVIPLSPELLYLKREGS